MFLKIVVCSQPLDETTLKEVESLVFKDVYNDLPGPPARGIIGDEEYERQLAKLKDDEATRVEEIATREGITPYLFEMLAKNYQYQSEKTMTIFIAPILYAIGSRRDLELSHVNVIKGELKVILALPADDIEARHEAFIRPALPILGYYPSPDGELLLIEILRRAESLQRRVVDDDTFLIKAQAASALSKCGSILSVGPMEDAVNWAAMTLKKMTPYPQSHYIGRKLYDMISQSLAALKVRLRDAPEVKIVQPPEDVRVSSIPNRPLPESSDAPSPVFTGWMILLICGAMISTLVVVIFRHSRTP